MPTGILDLMGYMQGQADAGRQQGKQSRLAQLASQAYAAPQAQRSQLVQQAIGVDPQSGFALDKSLQGGDDERMQRVGQMAGMLVNLPPEARAQAYPGIVQQLHSIGLGDGLPDQWDDSLLPYAQQLAGISGAGNGVQSTYIDAQGNRVAIMRDGSTQVLGQNAPQNQIIDTGNGFYGVNKGTLQAAPVMIGGEVPFTIDPNLPPEVQAQIRNDPAAGSPEGISQLRKAPPAITPYQGETLAIQRERLAAAQQARDEAAAARKAAQEAKAEQERQGVQQRQAAAAESADQLVSAIDALTGSEGFGRLGTPLGDIEIKTPLVRNAAKDAQAQLKNIAGQVAIATMARLKALSKQGATGFGALSEKELKLLENSIATLSSEQISNAQLRKSLKTIRDSMSKVTQWQPQGAAQAQEAVLRYNPQTGKIE